MKRFLLIAVAGALGIAMSTSTTKAQGPLSTLSRGAGRLASSLDPTTHTPREWVRNVATAPVAATIATATAPLLVMQGVNNVARGRNIDAPAPRTTSTLSSTQASIPPRPAVQRPVPPRPPQALGTPGGTNVGRRPPTPGFDPRATPLAGFPGRISLRPPRPDMTPPTFPVRFNPQFLSGSPGTNANPFRFR